MKRISHMHLLILLLGVSCMANAAGPNQPVYIYLHSRISDQINIELSEDRLRHLLAALDRYRKEHPESHISATLLVSGAMSQTLSDRNEKNGIKDLVLDHAKHGLIELGYDGTDEPTYKLRPLPDLSNVKTAEDRWLARGTAAESFLTELRNPLFGTPERGVGGLKQMQEILGEAACVTGLTEELGGDSEFVQHLGRYNSKAIMFGVPENNPARIPGYRGSIIGFGTQMSPVPETAPELYWQDNVLRSADSGDSVVRVVRGDEGVNAIKTLLSKLDRSKVHIIHVELVPQRMYLQPNSIYPPLKLAYEDPGHAKWPRALFRDADDLNFAYSKEDGLIKWLIEDFFPANPGSRFASSTDLKQMTAPSTGFSITTGELRSSIGGLLKSWGSDTLLPSYLRVEGRYLSLADLFQVMTDALAEMNNSGKLPQSVQVRKVYGPVGLPDDHGPNLVELTAGSVAKECAAVASRLHDETWNAIPKNIIPSRLRIDGTEVNAAQFLRLMAEALTTASPETKLKTKMTYMFSTAAHMYPSTRTSEEKGAMWTVKPAPLGTEQPLRSQR